jgi:hypothetical protein
MAADADQADDAEQPAGEYRYFESGLHVLLLRLSRMHDKADMHETLVSALSASAVGPDVVCVVQVAPHAGADSESQLEPFFPTKE